MSHGRTLVTDTLVDFVRTLEPGGLPPGVTEAASLCLMDWLGTAIRGAREPLARALGAVIVAAGGEPQATVVGQDLRTSALLACLANGAQSHALDFDDTHIPSLVHGSAPVAPVVLALGEWRRISPAEALTAFVAGFEVETRLGRALGLGLAERGWHVTGILGHFGAAAAAAKLLGLPADQIRQALGIAGTQAAGLEQAFGTMSKPLHPGKAAMNGLLAALLAKEGYTGPVEVLEGPAGLPATFLGRADLGPVLDDLGKRFEILENSTKPHAACHLTHATIDAGRAIRERFRPAADAIARVECQVFPLTLQVAANPAPETGLEGKFSLAYCAALALTGREAGEAEFTDAMIREPELRRLANRVEAAADPALGVGDARMRVRLHDGRVLEEQVKAARGMADNPQSREELEAKFRRLAGVVLPPVGVDRLLDALRRLDDLAEIGVLARLASPQAEA